MPIKSFRQDYLLLVVQFDFFIDWTFYNPLPSVLRRVVIICKNVKSLENDDEFVNSETYKIMKEMTKDNKKDGQYRVFLYAKEVDPQETTENNVDMLL